ncbi:MAG: hypothetical protein CO132_00605 [Candidatus Kerfeldbacteria bacterium CG_4_9_14_3_um_filter_45_8]|nr:MAG: hypothetical protein CO132_00605 [Candidatus Kerfeldbacteria bacterium CG_4_9_14_3_um_filter_45_8]
MPHRPTQYLWISACIGAYFWLPNLAYAAPAFEPIVQVIDLETKTVQAQWSPFSPDQKLGVEVSVGDFNGDGKFEYVTVDSGGPDALGRISTHKLDGTLIASDSLVGVDPGTRLSLATGDIDGDGQDEILVSQPQGVNSEILILNNKLKLDQESISHLTGFPEFVGGVTVATGNVLGDAREEILVGTGPGLFPLVRILDSRGVMQAPDISPFAEVDTEGVVAAAVNTTGGNYSDVVVGRMNGAETWIKNYQIDPLREYPVLGTSRAWSYEYKSGVRLTGVDIDNNGTEEIAVTPAGDQRSSIKFFRGDATEVSTDQSLELFSDEFRGGASLAVAQVDQDPAMELIVTPQHQQVHADSERGDRWIEVNLSEQIEYIWEDGYLRNVYLVSTGLPSTPTPAGEFSITKKFPFHDYVGDNYSFLNTPWNLRFLEGGAGKNMYLHTAYWHNNFGHPMSHGCINMRQEDVAWVFNWADIGTAVWTHF